VLRTAASYDARDLQARRLASGTTVSVILPARDEAATIAAIVGAIRTDLMDDVPLVDELLVVDSGSTDDTAAVALAAGARVVAAAEVRPELGDRPGKGEALWKGLLSTSGDVVVFLDADLEEFSSAYVVGLLGPLLTDPSVSFVKAAYDRPLLAGGQLLAEAGGRVTELVARPLLNAHWPELSVVVQPLAGEYTGRRSLLESLPFVTGYGVDLALLVDVYDAVGLDGLAQVDLGRKSHRHQSDVALGQMSAAIWRTALDRLDRTGRVKLSDDPGATLTQFRRTQNGFSTVTSAVVLDERPPVDTAIRERFGM
jgi:glucosyl-3-phosphoglycerate synthase